MILIWFRKLWQNVANRMLLCKAISKTGTGIYKKEQSHRLQMGSYTNNALQGAKQYFKVTRLKAY